MHLRHCLFAAILLVFCSTNVMADPTYPVPEWRGGVYLDGDGNAVFEAEAGGSLTVKPGETDPDSPWLYIGHGMCVYLDFFGVLHIRYLDGSVYHIDYVSGITWWT
jgi:hypothetical protein